MLAFNRCDGLKLTSLAYFDLIDYESGMSFREAVSKIKQSEITRKDPFYEKMKAFVDQLDYSRFDDFVITDYINHNNASGLVLFVMENADTCIVVIRGSEYLDAVNHDCGWEDWRDNLEIFLDVTAQQLEAADWLERYETNKKMILTGHSKGGNLALFLGTVCTSVKFEQIEAIMVYNAPGLNDDTMNQYQTRLQDEAFLAKVTCIENEHDCVSSCFNHVKKAQIYASLFDNHSVHDAMVNHQLYAFEYFLNDMVAIEEKSAMPKVLDAFINKTLTKQPYESRKRFVDHMMEYVRNDLDRDELYHMVLYQLGKRSDLFSNYSEEEIRTIEVENLLWGFQMNFKRSIENVPEKLNALFEELIAPIKEKMNDKQEKAHEEN